MSRTASEKHVHDESCIQDGHSHEESAENHSSCGHSHCVENHSDCKGHAHAPQDFAGGQEHEDEHPSDEIIFPASQARRVDFEVREILPSSFRQVIKCSGEIQPAQGDRASVVAPVSGVVRFAGSVLADGRPVASGKPVLYIDTRKVDGGDVSARAEAAYKAAEAQFERSKRLLADRIISDREYELAEQQYAEAKSAWLAVVSDSGSGVAVSAPFGGYVSDLSVGEGDFVQTGDRLMSVVSDNRMRLVACVPQRYYSELGRIESANFVACDGSVVAIEKLNGRKIASAVSASVSSPLLDVTFEFDAAKNAVPGSLVQTYLLSASRRETIAVPVTAVTESQGRYFVYVQVDDDGYVRREVKTGASDGERIEILSGVEAGERVVTRGAVHVKMAAMTAIPHAHSH